MTASPNNYKDSGFPKLKSQTPTLFPQSKSIVMKFATLLLAASAHAATITRWHTEWNIVTSSYDTTTISTLPPTTVVINGDGETISPVSPSTPTPATENEPASPTTQSTPTTQAAPTSSTQAAPTSPTTQSTEAATPSSSRTSTEPTTANTPTSSPTSATWTPTTFSTARSSSTTSSSSSSAAPTDSLNEFQQDILDQTNKKRALHSAPAVTWNWTLAEFAADYAKKFDCNNVQLIHSGGPYGENLAAGYVGGIDPVNAWYDEIKDYNYNSPGFSEATGHFTQLIWKASTQMGCAKVTCDNVWRQYTICEYSPRGNIVGTTQSTTAKYFSSNVLPLS